MISNVVFILFAEQIYLSIKSAVGTASGGTNPANRTKTHAKIYPKELAVPIGCILVLG
jgi:hypothetical protein